MAVAGVRFGHRKYYRLGLFLLILSLVVAPMNGSRSVIFGFFLPLPIILYLLAKQSAKKVIAVFVLGMVIFGVFTTVQLDIFQSGWDTFTHRATTASDRDSRIESMLMDPIYKLEVGGGTGYGTGATHQAVSGFSSGQRISIPDVGYEGERGRVIIELGIVGFLFFLLLKIYITFIAWKAMNKADKPVEYLLSITAFCFLFSSLVVGSIVFNHIEGALYWLCAGFVIWVWNKKL